MGTRIETLTGSKFNNGELADADEVNEAFNGAGWNKYRITKDASDVIVGGLTIVGHSDDTYSFGASTDGIFVTTDDGSTFTSKNTDITASTQMGTNCKADRTRAIIFQPKAIPDTNKVAYTTDSGTTWTTGTVIGIDQDITDISYPTSSVAIIVGNDAGADYVWRSTDGGSTWTAASTQPTSNLTAIDMFDGSNGVAVDSSLNIWKTTDGGDTWIDTTYNVAFGNARCAIFMTSTTEFVYLEENGMAGRVEWRSGSVSAGLTATKGYLINAIGNTVVVQRPVKTAKGNYYILVSDFTDRKNYLFRYDGTDIFFKEFGQASSFDPKAEKLGYITEAGDNQIYLFIDNGNGGKAIELKDWTT